MKISVFAILDKTKPNGKYKRIKLGGGQARDRSSD
jgi:hypothetical protein